jgi:orotate phosphoribosyltransferase
MFNNQAFNDFIINHNVIGFFDDPITLKSGKKSHMYINWRHVSNDVVLLESCALFVIEFCLKHKLKPDCFFGVAEGATKLGIITQYLWAKQHNASVGSHKLCMGRAKPKQHGSPEDKYFVGEPSGKIIVLEDVTTTGQSMIEAVKFLQSLNKSDITCIGLTNRETADHSPTVADQLKKLNITYYHLSTSKELLEQLTQSEKSKSIQPYITKELSLLS